MLSSLRWMDDVPVLSATSSDVSSTALLVHCSLSAALGIGESKRDILYVGQKCRYVKNDKDIKTQGGDKMDLDFDSGAP